MNHTELNRSPLAVIAVGGNSLIKDANHPEVRHQWDAVRETASNIANLIQAGWRAVITHGTGPQVGYILRRNELAMGSVHTTPIDLIVADTQGSIGYMLQQALNNEFYRRELPRQCVTIVTQVRQPRRPCLCQPIQTHRRFPDEDAAHRFEAEGWSGHRRRRRGWRRSSPRRRRSRSSNSRAIAEAAASGWIVIAPAAAASLSPATLPMARAACPPSSTRTSPAACWQVARRRSAAHQHQRRARLPPLRHAATTRYRTHDRR